MPGVQVSPVLAASQARAEEGGRGGPGGQHRGWDGKLRHQHTGTQWLSIYICIYLQFYIDTAYNHHHAFITPRNCSAEQCCSSVHSGAQHETYNTTTQQHNTETQHSNTTHADTWITASHCISPYHQARVIQVPCFSQEEDGARDLPRHC